MKKFKRVVSLAVASMMIMGALSACGNKADETKAPETQAVGGETSEESKDTEAVSGEKVTLVTASMMGGTDPNTDKYNEVIAAFQDAYPNVTIEDSSSMADQTWKAKIATQFSVGDEPDVIQFFTDNNAKDVLAADKFVTVEEIQAEYPEYAANTLAMAWEASANPDGVNRAVPTTGYWEGLFCNKDLFDEYELELSTDWDSLLTAIEVFNENGIVPIALSLNEVPHYWVEHLMFAEAGVDGFVTVPTDDDGNLVAEAPEGWVNGLNRIKELYELGAFSVDVETISNDAVGELFRTKQAAMQLDGSWFANGVTDQDNTVVISFPNTPTGSKTADQIIGGISSGFYITRKAWEDPAKRDYAVKFVMMNTSVEQIGEYWNGNGIATVDAEPPADMTPLGMSGVELSKSANTTVAPTDARISSDAYSVIIAGVIDIVTGARTAEDVIVEALEVNIASQQ